MIICQATSSEAYFVSSNNKGRNGENVYEGDQREGKPADDSQEHGCSSYSLSHGLVFKAECSPSTLGG